MNDDRYILKVEELRKDYPIPQGRLCIFDHFNFNLEKGSLIAIMGASGVGKTTLLNLLGALDAPTSGKIIFQGKDIFSQTECERAEFRNKKIGFIFQFYHLLPEFTALENVCIPLFIRGIDKNTAETMAMQMLKEVKLEEKAAVRPNRLSGGEQQRIAIARALINEPQLLLADEPTGNLDWKTGKIILELIQSLHSKKGLSSIIVTHNEKVARFCQKAYILENGDLKLFTDF